MIKYRLLCNSCSNNFDSWFATSKEYEKLKKLKLFNCPICNSTNIDKSLMAPSVINKKNNNSDINLKKHIEIKNKLKEYKKFIKNNFEYVGENFAHEARSIHYKTKKKEKGIYGKASIDEVNELLEEGIETEVVPWINDKEN
tara:strand:- start:492 stop:917 length:426 start_codon:yes stop_codon:yes gene_type:complete